MTENPEDRSEKLDKFYGFIRERGILSFHWHGYAIRCAIVQQGPAWAEYVVEISFRENCTLLIFYDKNLDSMAQTALTMEAPKGATHSQAQLLTVPPSDIPGELKNAHALIADYLLKLADGEDGAIDGWTSEPRGSF